MFVSVIVAVVVAVPVIIIAAARSGVVVAARSRRRPARPAAVVAAAAEPGLRPELTPTRRAGAGPRAIAAVFRKGAGQFETGTRPGDDEVKGATAKAIATEAFSSIKRTRIDVPARIFQSSICSGRDPPVGFLVRESLKAERRGGKRHPTSAAADQAPACNGT